MYLKIKIMNLEQLYKNKRDFTVIGITGRTGSGCTKIAEILSRDVERLKQGLRDEKVFNDKIFKQKFSICKNYITTNNNWQKFDVIKYKDVLLLYILICHNNRISEYKEILKENFKESSNEDNSSDVEKIIKDLESLFNKKSVIKILTEIEKLQFTSCNRIKYSADKLKILNKVFFSNKFKHLSKLFFEGLENYGYYRRTLFLHWVATNIRSCSSPILNKENINVESLYNLSKLINQIIKSRRNFNETKKLPTNIVIDSLRNSLEISYFKERYSAFYMLSTKDVIGNRELRLQSRFKNKIIDKVERERLIKKIIELDNTEYRTNDFNKGEFSSPDVENCIQKSEYHIYNLRVEQIPKFTEYLELKKDFFLSREEQLMKFISLIKQPGLITPSSVERTMQIANTAKVNSGCISRKVGAVITDENFYIKAIGWNDVPKGHTPCNLRDVNDIIDVEKEELYNNDNYTPFEKGNISEISNYKYKNKSKSTFPEILKDYYSDVHNKNRENLVGRNCAFCFKTIHNHYEGEVNQVHTKSLHAEENAMLQITKIGGQGVLNGNLFTTASPCELCSKKAYQLGIKNVYYIDPYPGISKDQIIDGGNNKPQLVPFTGAIGTTYTKLYESIMSIKDENTLALDLKPKNKNAIQFEFILEKFKNDSIRKFIESDIELDDKTVEKIIENGIKSLKK